MSQNQKIWGMVETVVFTASANRAAGDLVHEGLWYGVVEDTVASGADGAMAIRGGFECTKQTTSEVIASGDFIEFVAGGKVQKHDQGVKIGKAYEAAGATATKVIVVLMPELY